VALASKRYTWRHDSVLNQFKQYLIPHLSRHNDQKSSHVETPPIRFVKAGSSPQRSRAAYPTRSSLLVGASDWKCLVDFDFKKIIFPPEIYATNERPDVIIWSNVSKTVIIAELTCPAEEGIEAAQLRKEARYMDLVSNVTNAGWSIHSFTFEVGARGFVAHSSRRFLRRIGFSNRKTNSICKAVSVISARCSYAIYLARACKSWDAKRALIEIPCD
jgi:hypothetical protein